MTRTCPYCEDVLPEDRFQEHLGACIVEATKDLPRESMRYAVVCKAPGCYLNGDGIRYDDPAPAETLAYAHRNRWADDDIAAIHEVVVKDLKQVQPSLEPKAATGDKGGGNG